MTHQEATQRLWKCRHRALSSTLIYFLGLPGMVRHQSDSNQSANVFIARTEHSLAFFILFRRQDKLVLQFLEPTTIRRQTLIIQFGCAVKPLIRQP